MSLRDSTAWAAVRAASHIARERVLRTRATTRVDVPGSLASLTPAWWTDVLCSEVPGARVASFTVLASSAGTHQRDRIRITYNEAGAGAALPEGVFTKTLPTVVTRMIGGFNGTARAEGLFYRDLRPVLAIEAPRGFHTAFDRRSLAGINVLEDIVATRGASFCGPETKVTREMAEGMIDLLAALHAHDLTAGAPGWLVSFADWFEGGARKMRTEHYTQRALDRLAERLPRALLERRSELWPATHAATAIHRSAGASLLHSDVHIGNWYTTANGAMGLCDWQCVARGHGSRDLAYALSTALTVEQRRAWERELVERYGDSLARARGGRGDPAALWLQYRAQMLHALWMWTITLCHSRWLPDMQPEAVSTELIVRIATAIVDLDSIAAAHSSGAAGE
jgi:thiamine kinase-like enzyme